MQQQKQKVINNRFGLLETNDIETQKLEGFKKGLNGFETETFN